jgi:hydrogenase nickel incorporation protein HypB
MKVKIVRKIMADNEAVARENGATFARHGILCMNLMSGPGAGKTTVLEKTLPRLAARGVRCAVIEGDVEGDLDGARLDRLGVPVIQLNTRSACHLDAAMIRSGLEELDPEALDLIFVENVGNLVCPAGFDLGEDMKIVLLSVPEGDDKPVKYPAMFRRAMVLLINKIDLAPHFDFSSEAVRSACRRLNPALNVMELSARTEAGFEPWIELVSTAVEAKRKGA